MFYPSFFTSSSSYFNCFGRIKVPPTTREAVQSRRSLVRRSGGSQLDDQVHDLDLTEIYLTSRRGLPTPALCGDFSPAVMMPKSLVELCLEACYRHITSLTSVGEPDFMIPQEYVYDILSKVNSPAQLHTIETNSPHLQTETAYYWKRLIARDFPGESRDHNYTPKNPSKWHKIYERYAAERKAAQKEAEERMRQQFQGLQQKKELKVTKVVEQKLLPRAGSRPRGTAYEKSSGQLSFGRGSRTSNALQKARRQASEYRLMRGPLSNPCRTGPTGAVSRAPSSMIHEQRRAAQPAFRSSASHALPPSDGMSDATCPPNYVSDSSDDEQDGSFDGREGGRRSKGKFKRGPARSTNPNASDPDDQTVVQPQPARRPGLLSNAPRSKIRSKATPVEKGHSHVASTTATERPSGKQTLHTNRNPEKATPQKAALSLGAERSALARQSAADTGPSSTTSTNMPPSPSKSGQQSPQRPAIRKRKATAVFMPTKKRKA